MSHLTVAEVADTIRSSRDHVYNLIAAGDLPAINVGGTGNGARYIIARADLDRFLNSRKVQP